MLSTIAICSTICILGIVFMILFFNTINKKITMDYNDKVEKTNLEKQKFYSSLDRDKMVIEIEKFVTDIIDEYCLLYVNNTEEPYITEKKQNEIVEEVMVRIPDKLSPVILSKVKLSVNIKDAKDLNNYLRYVVSLGVMKKVLETNKMEPEVIGDMDKEADELLRNVIDDYNLKANF